MFPRMRILLLLGVPCLFFSLGVDAAAQAGRLLGTVAYAAPGHSPVVAINVRVVVAGNYGTWETRTDSNGIFMLVLPAGEYLVYAQGDPRFIQYQDVRGYVRPYTDSIIVPNPLFLVRAGSSVSLTSLALSQTAAWSERATAAYQNGLTFEMAAQNGGQGTLSGTVKYKYKIKVKDKKKEKEVEKEEIAIDVSVIVKSRYGPWGTRTDQHGNFVLVLPAGDYLVYAQGDPRFVQYEEVKGHVEAKTNSIITPEILYLVQSRE